MALADTGAGKTMISTGLAKELSLKFDTLLKNVQGEMVKPEGEAKVELRIGEKIS